MAKSKRRRKYRPGRKLGAEEAFAHIISGGSIYVHGKFQHHGWVRQWKVWMLQYMCSRGGVRAAICNANEPDQMSFFGGKPLGRFSLIKKRGND